jgi:hypothetical protein
MFDIAQSKEMWEWAYTHPYLFTIIKLGTPSVYAVILFAASKIIANTVGRKRR